MKRSEFCSLTVFWLKDCWEPAVTLTIILLAVFCLAYANGANDNFKGVATLLGSGTTSYRKALLWATLTTFLDPQMYESTRMALAGLLGVPKRSLILTPNPTNALQLLMQSFLRKPGDEASLTLVRNGKPTTIAM